MSKPTPERLAEKAPEMYELLLRLYRHHLKRDVGECDEQDFADMAADIAIEALSTLQELEADE